MKVVHMTPFFLGFYYPDAVHAQKPKRIRTAFSPAQLIELERVFDRNKYVIGQERRALAIRLSLSETQVRILAVITPRWSKVKG